MQRSDKVCDEVLAYGTRSVHRVSTISAQARDPQERRDVGLWRARLHGERDGPLFVDARLHLPPPLPPGGRGGLRRPQQKQHPAHQPRDPPHLRRLKICPRVVCERAPETGELGLNFVKSIYKLDDPTGRAVSW